jgi:hypothetical protein
VFGIDASAAAMTEASRRAARSIAKGGLENVVFAVASAEQPPPELAGRIDELTIILPWGSLLRGALALEDAAEASRGIADLIAPDGRLRMLVSVDARDRLALPPGALDPAALGDRWRPYGLALTSRRVASDAEIVASASTWAQRLGAGRDREVVALELRASPAAARNCDTVTA